MFGEYPRGSWEAGGHTNIGNGLLLCRWHHTFLHSQRWTVELDEHQQPEFRKPDGSRHQLCPRAPTDPYPWNRADSSTPRSLTKAHGSKLSIQYAIHSEGNVRSLFRPTCRACLR